MYTLQKAINEYWKAHPAELEQREQEEIKEIADSLGLKNAGEAWGAIGATIQVEIENDPYLEAEAKQALIKELGEITQEYTSIDGLLMKKWKFVKKLMGFKKKVKEAKALELPKLKKLEEITAGMVGKYKNLECVPFANDFRKKLKDAGIEYREVYIKAPIDSIYSDAKGQISINGDHYATIIKDKVYDNLYPQGIDIKSWEKDLGFGFSDGPIYKIR